MKRRISRRIEAAKANPRPRQKERVACKYCGEEFTITGIGLHESRCQRIATRECDESDPCWCGDPKPRGAYTCWRHALRGPELRALDEVLAKELKQKWQGPAAK